jgi:peptide/nickel transport system substrate-binding protein
MPDWSVEELVDDYKRGDVNRRQFVRILLSAGVGMPVISALLAACGGQQTGQRGGTSAVATPGSGVATSAPAAASTFTPTRRGGGGTVKILYWQAVSILNPTLSSGTKDVDGSRIFYEPLVAYDVEANLVPILAAEVPSRQNGGLAADNKSVTWKLKPNVKWHDGRPFTADDVVFTAQWNSNPEVASLAAGSYSNIDRVEKVDDLTVRVLLKEATLDWSTPWSTGGGGQILPRHVFQDFLGRTARDAPANLRPIGTGPYKIVEFRPNDLILAEINNDYHVPNRPFFDRVELKGGGDAVAAARAVLQTGEYDYAWNLQVPADQLDAMERSGQGRVTVVQGGSIEHVQLNYTDPNVEVDGQRSSIKTQHPFFTDLKVRQAFALAMDRKLVVDQLYGKTGEVALFYVYIPAKYVPQATWQKDTARANALLDEAGWRRGSDGVRAKDGKRMKVLFQTSVVKVRQDTQAIIKRDLEAIGVEVELKAVPADVFFAADPANPDNFPKFYADMQMYTATRSGPDDLLVSFNTFVSTQVRQRENNWGLLNTTRYRSPEFDALYNQYRTELDPMRAADIAKRMNQRLLDDVAVVPIVARGGVSAQKRNLKGTENSGWTSDLWRLSHWYRE